MPRRRPRLMPTTASRRNAGARALAFSFIGARARTYMSFSFKSEGISEVADGVIALRVEPGDARDGQIGRASCRERVCQYVSISVVAVSLKKQKIYKMS